jgi:hypothetical protein
VPFAAGHLNQTADRLEGELKVMIHDDFGCIFDLAWSLTEH